MKSNVKSYSDSQLLRRVKSTNGFKGIPKGYWLLFVRSNENSPNTFDDKVYLYKGEVFIKVATCTTNAGLKALKNYKRQGLSGAFITKSDEWFYDIWKYGLHRGKMPALRQVGRIFGYRDNNDNNLAEEIGKLVSGYFGINFHTIDYNLRPNFFRRLIGGWSWGCFVVNKVSDYLFILNKLKPQKIVSFCLIKEF